MAEKYYVVWKGHKPGVYNTWAECEKQIRQFPGAVYKSFKSRALADRAYRMDYSEFMGNDVNKLGFIGDLWDKAIEKPELKSLCVDAACSGNPGKMEYRGVETVTGKEIFRQGPFDDATNNIGEFLAVVHALAMLKNSGSTLAIYTDSTNAIKWVKQKKAATKLVKSFKNQKVFQIIHRAETWLKNNTYENRVLKWKTEIWGEIPADFGRK
jgi:ribonuclease HI